MTVCYTRAMFTLLLAYMLVTQADIGFG